MICISELNVTCLQDHLQATEMFHQKNNSAPFRKRYLDIGANLGYFSLLAASRGYEVTAFEAMAKNARLIKVSLCANPELEKRITLHNVGLADKSKKCFIVSSDSNQADGILKCNPPKGFDPVAYSTTKEHDYQVRGEVQLETMNTMLSGDYFMMKIDIEGAEPMALSKEGSDEYFEKFGIKYFITESTKGSTSRVAYFQRLFSLGYSLRPVKYQLGVGQMWNGALVGSTPEQIAQNSGHDFFGGLSRQSQMTKSATVRKLKVSGLLESLQAELVAARWPERITQNEECLLRAEKLMQTSNDGRLLRPDMFKWAKANRAAEQFDILVHATGDIVSNMIINTGSWEKVSRHMHPH